jgi:hypothetical protein
MGFRFSPEFFEPFQALKTPAEEGEGVVLPTEYAQRQFADAIRNRGGAYLGVATHQNFSFIAAARSELAFIVDRSSKAINALQAHRLSHLQFSTSDEYIDFWCKPKAAQLNEIIGWNLSVEEEQVLSKIIRDEGSCIGSTLYFDKKESSVNPDKFSWLEKDEDYEYIRRMFMSNAIKIIRADLQNQEVFSLIASAASKAELFFSTLYLSNVEDHLSGRVMGVGAGKPLSFWSNIRMLTMSEEAKILRTVRTYANISPDRTFHYITQTWTDFLAQNYTSYEQLLEDIGLQITEQSIGFTQMPVPKEERDYIINQRGWHFP